MTVAEVLALLKGVRKTASGYIALCPAHADARQSLSLSQGRDGNVLLHCFAGCTLDAILAELGLQPGDLFADQPRNNGRRSAMLGEVAAEYEYGEGARRYHNVRYLPKDFRIKRWDAAGGAWTWGAPPDEDRRLYHEADLADVPEDGTVLLVEGEKDVDLLRLHGFHATTIAQGAEAKWLPQFTEVLRGHHVVLVPDNDAPGRKFMDRAGRALAGAAASLRWLELPDLREKGDASDWFQRGGTGDAFAVLLGQAPPWAPPASGAAPAEGEHPPAVRLLDAKPAPAPPWAAKDFLLAAQIAGIAGDGGSLKSTTLLHTAGAFAGGYPVFDRFPTSGAQPVFYVSEEDDEAFILNRVEAFCRGHQWDRERVLGNFYLRALHGALLDDSAWQTTLLYDVGQFQIHAVFVDPLSDCMAGDDSKNVDAKRVVRFFRQLVALGVLVAYDHHITKPTEGREKKHLIRGATTWYNASRTFYWAEPSPGGLVLENLKASRTKDRGTLYHLQLAVESETTDRAIWRTASLTMDPKPSTALTNTDVAVLGVVIKAMKAPNSRDLRLLARRAGAKVNNEEVDASKAALVALGFIRWEKDGREKKWHATDEGRAAYADVRNGETSGSVP